MSMSTLMETNDDNAFIGGSTFHMSVRIDALYGLERSMRCILARAVVSWRRQLLELLIRLFCRRYVYWHELRANQCILCLRKKGLFGLVMYNVVGSQRTRCCPDSDLFVCSALYYSFLQQKVVLNQQSVLGALALFLFFSLLLLLSFSSVWLLKRLSSNSSREV